MLQKIVVTFDRLSVHTLSSCVHTLDQVEFDSQHAPSSSSGVGFGWYPKSASTRVPESASTRINQSPLQLALSEVCFSWCPLRLVFIRSVLQLVSASTRVYPESTSTGVRFEHVLPLKLGKSGIVNPRSNMNCGSFSASRGLVKMPAFWRFVLMCWRSTSSTWTRSWMKWKCTSICFVRADIGDEI